MKLNLEYIAGIEKALIEFDGLTIITGDNSTGKSTVGKTIDSVFNTFLECERNFQSYIAHVINSEIKSFVENLFATEKNGEELDYENYLITRDINIESISKLIVEIYNSDLSVQIRFDVLEECLKNNLMRVNGYIYNLDMVLKENKKDNFLSEVTFLGTPYYESVIRKLPKTKKNHFMRMFGLNIGNHLGTSKNLVCENCEQIIELNIKGDQIKIVDNELENYFEIKNTSKFIDNKMILNNKSLNFHRINTLRFEDVDDNSYEYEQLSNEYKYDDITKKINEILDEELIYSDEKTGEKKKLPIGRIELASGVKIISLLDNMLKYGEINNKDVLIFDEPEVHVHPKLQIELAKILCEIQKSFDLTMVITTHSPYFLSAMSVILGERRHDVLKVYSMKGSVGHFYSEDVTDDLSSVLSEMAEGYKKIDKIYIENMENSIDE